MVFGGNLYPNSENYPQVSFPQELTPPDTDPDFPTTILVEYAPEWAEVLAAACDQLLQFSSWAGTNEEKGLAVDRANLLKVLLQTPVEIEETVPAPYWDSEEDVDDEMPVDEQEWYGLVTNPTAPADELTFVENAVIWILTGFVALVLAPSLPVGAAAAISFRTLATRFTLAFNRGDIIEQIRIIIDAQDYGEVDTSAMSVGDIVEVNIDGLEDLPFHDILLVVTEVP